jgi:hypothetical protein
MFPVSSPSLGRWRLLALALLLGTALVAVVGLRSANADDAPRAARAANGNFACQGPNGRAWAEVAAAPNSYAVGNCANGTHVHRVAHSDAPNSSAGWEIGEVFGSYAACGVVKANESVKVGEGTYSACNRNPSHEKTAYASTSDCKSGQEGNCEWDPNLHGDFTTRLLKPCTAYANARPFSANGATGIDPVGTLDATTETQYHFRMRYVTKDRRMVLGFLGHPTKADSDYSPAPKHMPMWVFLDASCVTLPHEQGL